MSNKRPGYYDLTIEGRPQPKQRPRVTNSHTYTPGDTVQAENRILAEWVAGFGNVELEGDLEVQCAFYYSDRRTADIDNLIKLVCDALGGGGEGYRPFNDRQVKKLRGEIYTGVDDERTEILVGELQ